MYFGTYTGFLKHSVIVPIAPLVKAQVPDLENSSQ
jgi:hypothetical protein